MKGVSTDNGWSVEKKNWFLLDKSLNQRHSLYKVRQTQLQLVYHGLRASCPNTKSSVSTPLIELININT